MEGVAAATGAFLRTRHTLPFTPGAAHFLPSAGQLIFQWQKPLSPCVGWGLTNTHLPWPPTPTHTPFPATFPCSPVTFWASLLHTDPLLPLGLGKGTHPLNSLPFPWHRPFSIEHNSTQTPRQVLG